MICYTYFFPPSAVSVLMGIHFTILLHLKKSSEEKDTVLEQEIYNNIGLAKKDSNILHIIHC